CEEKIPNRALRLGYTEQAQGGKYRGQVTVWHHAKCFFQEHGDMVTSIDDFEGAKNLKDKDRERLEAYRKGENPPEEEEEEPPKPKKSPRKRKKPLPKVASSEESEEVAASTTASSAEEEEEEEEIPKKKKGKGTGKAAGKAAGKASAGGKGRAKKKKVEHVSEEDE
ncbi:hypothetical protein HK102_008909, partial [Quaeritorhiza haematococci]